MAITKLNNHNGNKITNYYFSFLFISLSFAGLILSHNAISLIFTPFIIFYVLYLYFEKRDLKKLTASIISLFFGLLLSFFFWFPAFLEGKYTLRDIVTAGAYQDRFVNLKSLIYGSWNFGQSGDFSVQIGIAGIVLFILSVIFFGKLVKYNERQKFLFAGTLLMFMLSVFLMLPQSDFIWQKLTALQKLQFPWRFLSLVVFSNALIGAFVIYKLKINNLMTGPIIFIAISATFSYWHPKDYKSYSDKFFQGIYNGTTDTGESSPIWSVRFMEKSPKDTIEVIEGNAQIVKLDRKSTYHEYVISADSKIRIRENILYFPGWKVYDNYNEIKNVEFQDPKNRGIITFYLDKGMHDVILKFEDTKVRKTANLISILAIIAAFFPFVLFLNPRIKKLEW